MKYDLVICGPGDTAGMFEKIAMILKNHGLVMENHDLDDLDDDACCFSISKEHIPTDIVKKDLE